MTYYSRNDFYIGQCVAIDDIASGNVSRMGGNLPPIRDSHLFRARQNSNKFFKQLPGNTKIINIIP
jgi:hypothetical protein